MLTFLVAAYSTTYWLRDATTRKVGVYIQKETYKLTHNE